MSLADISQFLTAVAAVGALILSWKNQRAIKEVHVATNSLTDRLVETTRAEAKAAGVKEEKERAK